MILEIHDAEEGNSLAGRVNIDYDYMAEQWVQDLIVDKAYPFDKFILRDDLGVRAVWKVHDNNRAELIERADRFTGEWVLNSVFVPKY